MAQDTEAQKRGVCKTLAHLLLLSLLNKMAPHGSLLLFLYDLGCDESFISLQFSGGTNLNASRDLCRLLISSTYVLDSLYCKQYEPRSDCSFESSLIRVHIVCFPEKNLV